MATTVNSNSFRLCQVSWEILLLQHLSKIAIILETISSETPE